MLVGLNKKLYNKPKNGDWPTHYETIQICEQELTEHITSGYSFTPGIFRDNYRKKENWLQAEIIALDFDDDVSTQDLSNHKYSNLLWLIYATPSSSKVTPKVKTTNRTK